MFNIISVTFAKKSFLLIIHVHIHTHTHTQTYKDSNRSWQPHLAHLLRNIKLFSHNGKRGKGYILPLLTHSSTHIHLNTHKLTHSSTHIHLKTHKHTHIHPHGQTLTYIYTTTNAHKIPGYIHTYKEFAKQLMHAQLKSSNQNIQTNTLTLTSAPIGKMEE